jgi:hypothetical protein
MGGCLTVEEMPTKTMAELEPNASGCL